MQDLAKELQSLGQRLAKVKVAGPPASKKRNRKKKGKTLAAASTSQMQSNTSIGRGGRSRKRSRAVNISSGDVVVSKMELVATVKIPANKSTLASHIDILPESFPFLNNLFKSFERVRYQNLKFWWAPLVGTTYGGAFSMGMDWDWSGTDIERKKIAALSPNKSHPIYLEGGPLVLPPNRLMGRVWYTPRTGGWADKGPGRLNYCVDGTSSSKEQVVGDLWVAYTVVLSGTNPE